MNIKVILLPATLLVLSACEKPTEAPPPPPAKPAAETAPAPAALTGEAAAIDLVKKVLACKFDDENGSFDSECPAYTALSDSKLFEDGKLDGTVVKLLEDPDLKIRILALGVLRSEGKAAFTDKALAERILKVAEGEKSEHVQRSSLGTVVGRIDVTKTGTFERIKALAKTAPEAMAKDIAGVLLLANNENPAAWDWTKQMVQDSRASVRKEAMRAFFQGGNGHLADACKVQKENFGHKDPVIAAMAMSMSSGRAECIADVKDLLARIKKLAKAGKVDQTDYLSALGDSFKNPKMTPALVKEKLAVAQLIVGNPKHQANIRRGALELVYTTEPKAGKTFAKKFIKDKESSLADLAKQYVAK